MVLDAELIVNTALDKAVEVLGDKPLYAEMILEQLLKAVPDHPRGIHLLGLAKLRSGKYQEAIEMIHRAMELEPSNADNYNNLALSYANLDNYDKAVEYLEEAIVRNPDHYVYLSNLGLQYRQRGEFERAESLFLRALEKNSSPEIWCNLGGLYHDWRNIDKAVECFEKAIELDAGCPAAHVDLAFVLCSKGEWARGMAEYEWRFEHFPQLRHYKSAYDSARRWEGQSLLGKTILLYGEQGYGDTIQFIRYVPQLKARGARVLLHSHAPLESFLSHALGVDGTFVGDIEKLAAFPEKLPEYDYQCSVISLPHLLGDWSISGVPYLSPLARLNLRKSEDYGGTFNIGISWAGSPAHPNDEVRSVFLKEFLPLSELPGVKLFSLQVGGCKRAYTSGKRIVDYSTGAEGMKLVDMTSEISTFEDTASVVSGMDLIVSVDTSLVHLAGALGVPCWMMTPFVPDWRWGLSGDRTAWYDSVRLYRQERPKDWSHVMERIVSDVQRESACLLSCE